MNIKKRVLSIVLLVLVCVMYADAKTTTKKESAGDSSDELKWPSVLVIDDFENGLEQWENRDSGTLTITQDAAQGKQALCWKAADDGLGHIVFKDLDRDSIDFSRYDLLVFDVKIEGKPIWNLNPIVQQQPAVYGFRGLYYSIDTLHPFGEWFTYSQDLTRWENAWPYSYNATNQEFQFEIHQLAGSGSTRVFLDNIRLMKNPLKIKPSYPGRWAKSADGSQVTEFEIPLQNTGDEPLTVRVSAAPGGTLQRFILELPDALQVPSDTSVSDTKGEPHKLVIRIRVPSSIVDGLLPWYGETARIAITADEAPGLVLYTDLAAGTKPPVVQHPCLIGTPERMKELQKQYASETSRKEMDKAFLDIVRQGEQALNFDPEYPPMAAAGRDNDPISGAKLVEVDVPNLPYRVYQDPVSGRSYSGPIYDAGMQGWTQKHLANASKAKVLGLAYVITGDRRFAEKAAEILKPYIEVYPKLPLIAPDQGSPVGSITSGTVRIGSTYMRERTWLNNMSIALDCIRPADMLSKEELNELAEKVFSPSAHNMMDHKVGAMNLQWMIQSASLMAGLAAELPDVTARALHDSHGITRLIDVGFLDDGNWWENPSYQNVAKIAAYPALIVAIDNGIIPWNKQFETRFKASYRLYGPDGRSPTLGTGGMAGYDKDDGAIAALAGWITDPQLAWVAYNRPPRRADDIGLLARFRGGTPQVPQEKAVSPIPEKTTIAPDYGGIAMRVPGTDQYCYFHFGRELTHGHRNKLSINAYGQGGWYSRNVMGGYGDNFHDFLETSASASSIMVDGKNADQDTGELLFHASVKGAELASAREVGAWKDVEHERSLVLTDRLLIVIDRCLSTEPHVYDWLHHTSSCRLELDRSNIEPPGIDRFGESVHYDSLPPTGRFKGNEPVVWTREKGGGMIMAFLPLGKLYVTHVTATGRPHDSIVWRQEGSNVRFAAAFLPLGKDQSEQVKIESIPVEDASGDEVGLTMGQAVRVSSGDETIIVLINYSGQPLKAGSLQSAERVSVIIE